MISCKTKKWGNSLGILIPKDEAEKLSIQENQQVLIEVYKKENPLRELFGTAKGIRKSTKEIIDEVRRELNVG